MTADSCSFIDGGPTLLEFTPPREQGAPARPALFLDRDGVINARRLALVREWSQFRFARGALDGIARAAKEPWPIVVVTNQDFVGTGYIAKDAMDDLHARMTERVRAAGGRIDAVYACIHPRWEACACRKPMPGMMRQAALRYGIDLARSWLVGDNAKDMRAGRAAGVRTALVDPRLRTLLQGARRDADLVARDLAEAVDRILAV